MAAVSKLLLLLLCLCTYHSLTAYAGDDPNRYTIGSINTEAICSESKATPSTTSAGATLALHHRHGPCSLDPSKETLTTEEILHSDQLRARNIHRKLSADTSSTAADTDAEKLEATVPTTLGTELQTLQYLINVSIGTPAVAQTVMIDTGSDISWVHCKPCSPCHNQMDSIFDPSQSTTYSPISCSSTACVQLGNDSSAGCSSSKQCQYVVNYLDGSNTTGTYSSDTLTLGPNVVNGFQFGCSRVVASDSDDMIAGLIGLGGGAQSLVSQTAATFGPSFSYCLPAPQAPSGFLTLGVSTTSNSNFTTTKMFRNSEIPTFYFVPLRGIRVGGTPVDVSPSVFAARSVVDSGTIITRLPPTAYSAMSSAFRAGMQDYRRAEPLAILDTCYDFSNLTTVRVPAVELVFDGGAVINLDYDGIMVFDCLAFAPNEDDSWPGLIGNVQQRTFEVLYDVGRSTMGFRAGAC
ncbi:hypothetical protein HU200_033690 [Digitaria exilis]|uniref:Peptidase A1 domain-containing protein n=1 Tax=Digitaria exilis TaxID=1010633 RepID=A0A835EKK4_9POAL|nr:hypothetical protein HU200_033690 [Digitaria exilis]CAB3482576.1 unnamed protein product [Digitaria exilis]CAB3505113.1 unnamed protein product [Digitaria exilis]